MIFNTDQGSQYTSEDWQKAMQSEGIQISMDGKGRWADNIIMERFWRTYKHESFLHREPRNLEEAIVMTSQWLEYYNKERPHSALGRYVCATKSRQKWIDIRGYRMI